MGGGRAASAACGALAALTLAAITCAGIRSSPPVAAFDAASPGFPQEYVATLRQIIFLVYFYNCNKTKGYCCSTRLNRD
jgi:hypothetical protein